MAADRQRLAQALAAEAARRKMFESIPEAAGQGLPQASERPMGWNDYLENLSIGLGRGAVNNLEGIKGMVTSPVETLKGVATGVTEAVRNPRMVAEALKQTGQRAMSGPLGLGEVIGENVNMMRVPGKPVMHELDVYHGTPHRFPATEANPLGEFDASKIGTGEGAQAYGHGIYLAESPEVAKDYATRLWKNQNMAGKTEIYDAGTKWEKAKSDFLRTALENKSKAERAEAEMTMNKAHENYLQTMREHGPQFYKADLPDEMIGRMLDWDKPLKDQPAAVQAIRATLPEDVRKDFDSNVASGISGGNAYANWIWGAKSNAETSEKLRQAGIPGISYADAGSRGQGGTGTRNFVVFPGEEKKVRILERK